MCKGTRISKGLMTQTLSPYFSSWNSKNKHIDQSNSEFSGIAMMQNYAFLTAANDEFTPTPDLAINLAQ